MRVIAVTVPPKLTDPPKHYPLELLYDLAFLNAEGHIIKMVDNAYWRYSDAAVLEVMEQTPFDLLLLYGPVAAYEKMWNLQKLAMKRVPETKIQMTRTEAWSHVASKHRPAPFYKHLHNNPNRMPYPQFGWLDLEAYESIPHPPYGEKPETWKKWLEVPVLWNGRRFSAKYVVEELNYFRSRWAIEGFRLLGDPFSNLPFSFQFRELMRLTDACLNYTWMCDVDIHAIDSKRLIWAKDSGCVAIRIPLPDSQVFMNDMDALDAAVNACHAIDLPVFVEFKVGWLSDTIESYIAAVGFCRTHELECRPEIITTDDMVESDYAYFSKDWSQAAERPPMNFTKWELGTLLGCVELMRREDESALREYLPQTQLLPL